MIADSTTLNVLLVEDNLADVVFFEEAVAAAGAPAEVHVVHDGHDAMRFLRRQGPYQSAPRPNVIVLDLNVPIKRGSEVLAEMVTDPDLRDIPVAVLTTSTSERCVCQALPPGRCLYFVKTDEFPRLQDIIRQIVQHGKAGQTP